MGFEIAFQHSLVFTDPDCFHRSLSRVSVLLHLLVEYVCENNILTDDVIRALRADDVRFQVEGNGLLLEEVLPNTD